MDEVMLWSDSRASVEQVEIDELMRSLHGYQRTLCPSHVSYWPAKLLWLKRHRASPLSAARFAGAKDHFFELITGERWTDPMTAASTGVFDSGGWRWDAALLAAIGVGAGQLPEIRDATARAPLRAGAAAALGLTGGLPVVLGGMDGPLAQLGAAGFSDTVATCTVGTSVAFRAPAAARTPDPAQRLWCYPISTDHWVVGGAGSNGGNVLDWAARLLGAEDRLAGLLRDALALPVDPALVFLPYLNGERSPLWRDDLRGALVGLASHHGPVDVARAALDGVAGAVQELAAAVAACVTEPAGVRLTGGFLHDAGWAQLVTDALGVATSVPDPEEATATGAAVLGWLSLGRAAPEPPSPARATQERSPDPAAHAALSAKSALMRDLRGLLFPRP
jgi:gluconokinase